MSCSRRHSLPLLLVLLLAVLIPSCAQGDGSTAHSRAGAADVRWPGRPFSPSSFWNRPLGADPTLSPLSTHYVAELVRQVHDYHPWMNTTSYSIPVYVVGRHQRTQHVTLDTWGPDLQRAFDHVPIPRHALAAAGTDASMTVWQPSRNRLWDFWQMRKKHGRWNARWGGEMDDVSGNPGYFTHSGQSSGWGATATGLPLLGGLVTFADLRRGYINHALAMALVETQWAKFSWPAQRTDGSSFTKGIFPIPEGMRFRLDPRLNIAALHLPKIDRMLAHAAQRYGIVVRDKAGSVVFYGQDPVTQAVNPWPAAFGGQYPNQALAQFPWSHLQALAPKMACCW